MLRYSDDSKSQHKQISKECYIDFIGWYTVGLNMPKGNAENDAKKISTGIKN